MDATTDRITHEVECLAAELFVSSPQPITWSEALADALAAMADLAHFALDWDQQVSTAAAEAHQEGV